ncbi:MAG: T9SS type A sorting domain-containing protein [candidate division Zixibacteria bacterium]|nr:T9SS type A sorting domain-containing protein [candidate division Zixibacteria bacterium]
MKNIGHSNGYKGSRDRIARRLLTFQNYPNPFNPTTTIEFSLPKKSHTLLEIFNIEGKKVQTLVDQVLSAGPHKFEWNASFSDNTKAPTGIYFYRLKSGEYEKSNKMILIK